MCSSSILQVLSGSIFVWGFGLDRGFDQQVYPLDWPVQAVQVQGEGQLGAA
jgi:hypothetical protein